MDEQAEHRIFFKAVLCNTINMGLPWWLSSKNSSAMQDMQETQASSLGWEGPLL